MYADQLTSALGLSVERDEVPSQGFDIKGKRSHLDFHRSLC